ncbi:SpvB/TcaC N-terminal domain-containing protein [Actinokineospora sp. UTMC 2448]|uniref:SpvB/TcaC N-terminal domain-containing protein n=1 Tax=Actinokineospora sp. UTMC 2448 TaxID=2268449 RepID=UPI0021642F6D|nr:SpvB/TcaC N-terminal domain-containing protein [Actinokineospora sp. UTMC 2448]UVS78199.1 Cell wall-associated polypeptide [Actinokineospora sp. UTMC 2448]
MAGFLVDRPRTVRVLGAFSALALVFSGSSVPPQEAAGPTVALVADQCADSGAAAVRTGERAARAEVGLPAHQVVVRPGEPGTRTIAHEGAKLQIGPDAVRLPVGVGITPLGQGQLPALDSGMTNVTGPHKGYRFTPTPHTFSAEITVTMPYDPALLTPDFTANDIFTFFYDELGACWKPLRRVAVDEANHQIVSATDHFTNMINATVTVPEHAEGASFDPNQLKDIQAADPAQGVALIAPPGPNSQGDNRLSHPIEVPPGREGLQPKLDVRYNSSGGNGWMGTGWDLATPAIVTETRWGVPRYDDGLETETYLLNGEQLTPVAHRGQLQARTADKVFHARVEGGFDRIVRRGDHPSNYRWEVTDKTGTTYFYGSAKGAPAPEPEASLADAEGNVHLWALREVRDANGNLLRYHHAKVEDPGVDGGAEPGRNLYPKRITYTGHGDTEGRYSVTFVRDRELGEPLRADKTIDARGGFKRVTGDLLRRVEVRIDDQPVRDYSFEYTTGAFAKTLLKKITQHDATGALFTAHEFDYFDDIRDAEGQYQAFDQLAWTSPGDDLGSDALNLTPDEAGEASALNANTSVGGGGHLYVGVGSSPTKSGSVGVKVGFNHAEDSGLLALIDVDGDSLPDKVFRDGGQVKYRRNLAGPGGTPRFSDDARALALPGIQSESSNSVTLGVEGYAGAVAAQLDYVNTFSRTTQYFADVNGDGITDLVNGTTVLFGRLGDGGVPVYGVSGDTPVPIGAGQVDTDGLLGDYAADQERLIDSFPLLDSVRRWVAPYDGQVRVTGGVRLAPETAAERDASTTADGVRVAIQHEGAELWAQRIEAEDDAEYAPTGVDAITVSRGQRLYFRVQSAFDGGLDEVVWNPVVSYVGAPAGVDVNGLAHHTFDAARDFTLAGRSAEVTVPLTGTMRLSGDLVKKAATTDDVTVVITRDGAPVFEQTLAANATGTIPVTGDIAVQKGQKLKWRVRVDSPIDVDQVEWIPRAHYTEAEGVDRLTAPDGSPLVVVHPPYDLDIYPVNGLTAPQAAYVVPADGQLDVTPALTFDFGGETPTARVAFTVKRRGALAGKGFFDIVAGQVTAPAPLAVDAQEGEELFFDFSTTSPTLRDALTGSSVTVDGSAAPHAFHSAAVEGAFPQPYRGWATIGYNGNRDRAGQPIVQDDLVIDESFADQLPDSVDPQAQKDEFAADPRITPPKVAPFSPSPQAKRWSAGEHNWVARDRSSSSRLGVESISLPKPEDFAGATAVPRLSRSEQISLTGSVGGGVGSLGGSIATGDSTGEVDFVDLNGDQFPDVVGAGGVQYTDMVGGLGATRGATPDGAVRRSETVSGNASAGSAARTIGTGRGHASPPGHAAANSAQSGNDMPPLGVGGTIGGSDADTAFDLIDINGDDLPDRVYEDGRVALNLGYRFGAPETWRNPAAVNDGGGSHFGLNIGFNTDFYGFAGGASYSEGSSSASATMMDLNGDGLMDRVFAGTPITVALNTGNGFEPAVPFHGSLTGLNGDQNAKLGGGVYFTFGICFTAVCVVINPGADISTGAARTEQSIRDIDGDGFADHLASTQDDELTVARNKTGRTNLLRSVKRPLGGSMEFDYTRDGNTYDLPQSRWVLSRVAVDDGHPGDGPDVQLVTYEYAGGHFDRLEREFLGYATLTERHRDPADGDAVLRSVERAFHNDSHYTRGLVRSERTLDAAGRPFVETEHTYQLRDLSGAPADAASTTATIFPALVRTDRRYFEGAPNPGLTTFVTMDYDAAGNMTRRLDTADAGPADDVETRVGFTAEDAACQASHIIGTPKRIEVIGGGQLMRHRESTVDCASGDVTQVRARLADGSEAVTDMTYRDDGNLTSVTRPVNKHGQRYRLDYTYDQVVGVHVESVTDSFGYRSLATYDLRFGLVETTTDFNGHQVRNTYDAAGRVDTVTGPYEAAENRVTIDFEYHPEAPVPYAITRHVDRQADGTVRQDTIDTITFVDGLRRQVQTKKDATVHTGPDTPPADVMTVSGRTVYDTLGRPVALSYPVTEPKGPANAEFSPAVDPVPPTRVAYDVLDRKTSTTHPDGTVDTTEYGFGADRSGTQRFQMVTTDANGKSKRTYDNVRELTTSVQEFNPAGGQPVIWTSYDHDPLGQLTAVTDDQGNATTAEYDLFGRRTVVDSPDSGRTVTEFDLTDNPIRKVTAKLAQSGHAIEYDYEFNRLSKIRYPLFTANDVTYTYGAPGAPNNGASRVVAMTDGAGSLTREYGPLGEVTRESRTVTVQGGQVREYATQYRYDTWNRVLDITYPDGEVLSYRYNSGGLVDGATGTKGGIDYTYLSRLDYDKFEQRTLLETGNGTRTVYRYDDTTRRLDGLHARLDAEHGDHVFQDVAYDYDAVGNVTSIRDTAPVPGGPEVGRQVGGPSTQTFVYDDLYRLTRAEGTYQSRNPRTDRYTVDLVYDSIHNITSKNQVHQLVSGGNTITQHKTTYNHAYGYGGAKPHAPDRLGPFTIAYDANGNQISRSQQPKPTRQLIWDEENRLACTHENVQSQVLPQVPTSCDNAGGTANRARHRYDDQGNRVVKDGAQFHVYPNQNYSTRGNQEFKHVYVGPTKLVTKAVEPDHRPEDRQYFSHGDHLGSTSFVTDDQGGLAEHAKYFAAGETWVSEHPSQPVPHQYTGKEIDPETGLYYFGARYYDPRTQLWQSPDPAMESYLDGAPAGGVYSPVNLASYTYAGHNPIRVSDPDGRWLNVVVGAGIGLVVGVGIEGVRQAVTGEFNAGRLAGAAGAGVISGAVAGATMGASLVVQGTAAVGAGVTGGVVSRAISGEEQTAGAIATDAVISGVTFGVVKGGGAVVRSLRGSPPPAAAPPTTPTIRPATQQPMGGAGQVLRDGQGATAAEIAASTGGPTGGSRAGQQAVRNALIDEADQAGGPYVCWRCNQTSTNPSNMHLGHRNVPTSRGGNLSRPNVCLEGAACNLSAGNRGGPRPGMSCAERGSCGAPYGRTD